MQTIDILIGLPGAGKTTYARNFVANNPGWMIVTVDNIREMLYGKYHYDEKDQLLVQRITGRTVKEVLRYGYDLIIDDSILILTKSARRELVCSIRSMFYGKVIKIRAVVFKYRLDTCLNRRLAEPRGVSKDHWERVITQMMEAFESMIDNELFDEVLFVDSLTIPTKVPNQAITSE